MKSVAIVGATGHIGRALAAHYAAVPDVRLGLFSRRAEATRDAFERHPRRAEITHAGIEALRQHRFDLVINAVGIGDPAAASEAGPGFYDATMRLEDGIDRAVARNPDCLTVFMSSGAVFGRRGAESVEAGTPAQLPLNAMTAGDWYGATKLAAELRHRAQIGRRILDVRIFGFVSQFIDLSTSYLLCDVVKAIRADRPLLTGPEDITRDYIGTLELAAMIDAALLRRDLNIAVDSYSLEPVTKFALLARLAPLGLKWVIDNGRKDPRGRVNYWSRNHSAAAFGYQPSRGAGEIAADAVTRLVAGR